MLFGNNPWFGGRMAPGGGPVMSPGPIQQPQTQFPLNPGMGGPIHGQQQPAYPAPTWPGQTPDGTYAQGLAQHYAQGLQGQAVPGSIPPPAPTAGPTGSPFTAPGQPAPMPPGQGGWRDAFHQAISAWQQQRQGMDRGDWRDARPDKQSFRGAF